MQSVIELVPPPQGAIPINSMFSVLKQDDLRVIFAGGEPIMEYFVDDVAARDNVVVQLNLHGNISEEDIARALDVSRSTVARAKRKYDREGVSGLVPRKRGRKHPINIKGKKEKLLRKLHQLGVPQSEIARRLGVTSAGVHRALKRLGLKTAREQKTLALESSPTVHTADEATALELPVDADTTVEEPAAEALPTAVQSTDPAVAVRQETPSGETNASSVNKAEEDAANIDEATDRPNPQSEVPGELVLPAQTSIDQDPQNRAGDRILARLGLLDDAAPLFGDRHNNRWAGLLLAVPILVTHGVTTDAVKLLGGIGPAFYGARNTVMAFLLMFLARINRPEKLKKHSPQELGAVLGLDRFPEMKTLRRKLRVLAKRKVSLELMKQQSKRHLERLKSTHLWLYIDGHVSVYSGKHKLNKHHVTRLRISLPSVLDYWINDERGDPLLVVTGVPRKMMVKLIPEQVSQLRKQGERRPITIVFDREGWSPAMFAKLDAMKDVYFLSYRKAKAKQRLPRLPRGDFETYEEEIDGEQVSYELADKGIYVNYGQGKKRRRLHLRQISRPKENGDQTHIVTNDWEAGTIVLAHRMFSRWGQENFFKYMSKEMEFDALLTYLMEDADGERMVANPERKKLGKQIKQQEASRKELMAKYGDRALHNEERQRRTMRGFKIANGDLGEEIRKLDAKLGTLRERHAALPTKIPVKKALSGKQPKQVHVETRRLMHCFRIAAIRTESALRELLRPHYAKWGQDGRTIIQAMLHSSGDLEVGENELHVILAPQSSPHLTSALAELCADLNQLGATFPGSELRLRFSVREAEIVS